jgi:hypothetical protein
MGTINKFEINGLVDTSQNVLENIQQLARASGCFITWDGAAGKWSVIVNETGTSAKSFDDSNILGNINVSGTGVADLYNSVQIEYPHKDLRDATDYLVINTPTADRFDGELDNQLSIALPIVNNPIQAAIIANQELRQSRVDKIIQFRTDFTANGLRAGDLIDITASVYGYTNKVFRIIQIEEEDGDEGALVYSIIALEYDSDVYDTTGVTYETRTVENGIRAKITNDEMAVQDDIDVGSQIGRLLAANAAAGIINSLFEVDEATGAINNTGSFADKIFQSMFEKGGAKPNLTHTPTSTEVCSGSDATIALAMPASCDSGCFFNDPDVEYDYTITGITESECSIDLEGTFTTTGKNGNFVFSATVESEKTATVTIGGASSNIEFAPASSEQVNTVPASVTVTEGNSLTVNVTTVGIADSTVLDYEVTGAGASKVSNPTGTVTITSNTGSFVLNTTNDGVFTGDLDIDITVYPDLKDYCSGNSHSATVTIVDASAEPVTCDYQSVPIIWCGSWDGTTGYLRSVSAVGYANLPIVATGGTAVPSAISVTGANTSGAAISIDDTVNVDTSVVSGMSIDVITSFSAPGSGPYLSGTTTTVKGY